MTLAQFKADPKMMKGAAELRGNVYYRSILEVLEDELRRSMTIDPLRLPQDDKTLRLGDITGFNRAVQVLRTIADPPAPPVKQIESTWGNLTEK